MRRTGDALPAQHGEHVRRIARAIIPDDDAQRFPAALKDALRAHKDGAARRIVARAVVQQVVDGPAKQRRVGHQDEPAGRLVELQRGVAGFARRAVGKGGDGFAQQRACMHRRKAERLGVVLKARGQVEIPDQRANALGLRAHLLGQPALGIGKRRLAIKRLRAAEDHGERRADVVGDAGDPVRARGVASGDFRLLCGDQRARAVELPGKLGGRAPLRQTDIPAPGERVDPLADCAQRACRPPAKPQADGQNQRRVEQEQRHEACDQRAQHIAVHVEVEARDAVRGHAKDEETKTVAIDEDGIVIQIPAGERGDLADRVGMVERRGKLPAPEHAAAGIQEHGEGAAAQAFFNSARLRHRQAVLARHEAIRKAAQGQRALLLGAQTVGEDDPAQKRGVDQKDEQNDGKCRCDDPPAQAGDGPHARSSFIRR